jgi:hypothetical protein
MRVSRLVNGVLALADLDSRSRSTCPQGSSMGRTGRQWEPCLRLAECNAGIRWNYVSE